MLNLLKPPTSANGVTGVDPPSGNDKQLARQRKADKFSFLLRSRVEIVKQGSAADGADQYSSKAATNRTSAARQTGGREYGKSHHVVQVLSIFGVYSKL